MKYRWIALAFVLAAALSAPAQENLTVNVPFDFVAAGKSVPAGEYTVRRATAGPEALLVHSATSSDGLILAGIFDSGVTGAKLVFHRYGDTYFLSSIVTSAGEHIFQASRQEREMARLSQPGVESVGTD